MTDNSARRTEMTFRTLIRRSLRFHWRSHLGVVLGAAIGSAALIGALVVGDCVRGSLRERVMQRLAGTSFALSSGDRFFGDDLLVRMMGNKTNLHSWARGPAGNFNGWPTNAIWSVKSNSVLLQLPAHAFRHDGTARANRIQLLGAAEDVLNSFPTENLSAAAEPVWLNEALMRQLRVRPGDELLLRIQRPTALSHDVAISGRNESSVALRVRVAGVASDKIGNLNLSAVAGEPLNAFVRRPALAAAVNLQGRANLVLAGNAHYFEHMGRWKCFVSDYQLWRAGLRPSPFMHFDWLLSPGGRIARPAPSAETSALLQTLIQTAWTLEDVQARIVSVENVAAYPSATPTLEVRTPRVLLDPPLADAASAANSNPQPILTYLATLLRTDTNVTPYSMVTAAGAPWTPAGLRDDEIVINQWLADDLHVKPGDEIALSYFLAESGAKLEEATNTFRVHSIVPMEMPWADRTLMPDFPGIEKAESTSEWDAGFPLTYEIRKKDDDYWKQYRGTPKAFITLSAGQKLWGNRFGNLTAIRFPILTNEPTISSLVPALPLLSKDASQVSSTERYRAVLERKILAHLKPEALGLRFEPMREQALKAANESQDFGGLFLGFSFFLIIAALLLMAMLFQFGLEQRAAEIATLLALGFTPKQVRKVFLREGVVLALGGGILGAIGGIYFARAMLFGLTTVWRDAVGATSLNFHVTGQTLIIGLLASVIVSSLTLRLALRRFGRLSPRELLAGEIHPSESKVPSLRSKVIGGVALAMGLGLVVWATLKGDTQNAGIFFGAGALVLIAGLSFVSGWLTGLSGAPSSASTRANHSHHQAEAGLGVPLTMAALAVRGCARRRKRSLATVAMLACGSFLIVSIGVFRLDANRDATQKTSGTGGFALIGETTLPVVQDLNSASGRDFFALNERDLEGVNIVPFRVRAGDEASCLNLNRAQKPRLLGVKPELLAGRFTFAGMIHGPPRDLKWNLLRSPPATLNLGSEIPLVPAIGDANSVQWAMGKKLGDTIDFTDAQGRPFKVWLVATVANSILQGQLIIDEAEFVKRFPGETGHRMFLMDAPSNAVSQVSATLSRALQDVGLELTPTAVRLNQFNAVQNTYLGTFQVLGGLGLLLGSVGLGIVVLRNVLERRSELAVLLAVGFRKPQVQRLLLWENGALLLVGLGLGVVAAAIAVLPALLAPAGQFPVASLALTLGAVLLNGALWTWAATRYAVRGDLLAALRNE